MHEDKTAATYEIRVQGVLSETLLAAFPTLNAQADHGVTILAGCVSDQSALHGILAQIESLGLVLLEVQRVPAATYSSSAG